MLKWEDVYTETQKKELIAKVVSELRDLIASREAQDLLPDKFIFLGKPAIKDEFTAQLIFVKGGVALNICNQIEGVGEESLESLVEKFSVESGEAALIFGKLEKKLFPKKKK